MKITKQSRSITALILAAIALASGCSAGANDSTGGSVEGREALSADLDTFFVGTDRPLPESGPTSVGAKNVWVLPCTSAAPGCSLPAEAVMEAGTAIGWDMKMVDGKQDPNTQSNQVRAAVAAGADGLITVAVDCPAISGPLQEAVKGGMKVMSIYGYDCDNDYTKGESLFSAEMNYGPYEDYSGLVRQGVSRAQAAYISDIGKTDSESTQVIAFRQDDVLATRAVSDGFDENIKACNCKVETVTFTGQDLVGGKLQQKASAALSRFPEATVVMAPYDASILLGIGAAVEQARASGRQLTLTGNEGLPANVKLIEDGVQQFAAGVPTEWAGWAAVDGMNRIFAGQPQVDEGIGVRSIDKDHPIDCRPFINGACVDFKADYKKIWAVN